nr:MAG TPA: hypothetical protein [Caudoviricetes sp.]
MTSFTKEYTKAVLAEALGIMLVSNNQYAEKIS